MLPIRKLLLLSNLLILSAGNTFLCLGSEMYHSSSSYTLKWGKTDKFGTTTIYPCRFISVPVGKKVQEREKSSFQCHCLLPSCALSFEPGGPDGINSLCSAGSSDRPEGQQPSAQCFSQPHSTFDLKHSTNSRNHWTRTSDSSSSFLRFASPKSIHSSHGL